MRGYFVLTVLALSLAGCGGGAGQRTDHADTAGDDQMAAQDAARDMANRVVSDTKQETLEKRVTALEHDVDRLKAEMETRQGLDAAAPAGGDSVVGPSSPLVPPSPPLPAVAPPPTSAPAPKHAQN
jgi:uncharacterized small protein (DUF1192 family)